MMGDRDYAWLAKETGISSSAIGGIKNDGNIPRADNALKIARVLGVTVDWLLTGEGEAKAAASAGALADRKTGYRPPPRDEAPDLDLVQVHEIDLAYGLGGTYSDGPIEAEVLHFPRTWLRSITKTPPAMLTFARGKGDSMEPTLQDGDIVLIDRSVQTIREQDAIWALTNGDIAMIKRVRVKGDRVTILSDNDRVPDDDFHHEEINVVGRVVFIGRRI
ncbi:XRE family transcriptional regulator [Sphingomonas canadensis]|nr:helix-turn-helix transcriptional regulator [Sphingomonas canadensis]